MALVLTGRAKEDSGSLFEFLLPSLGSVSAFSSAVVEGDGIAIMDVDGGELRTPRELSRRAILRQPLVVGHARRTVRAKSHPHVPARRTRDQKVVYKRWLLDRQQLFDTGDANDCGCALHAHGCYNGLVMALFARQKVEKLLLHRRIRFETKFAKLAPDKLVEMSKALGPVLTSPTDVFFDYKANDQDISGCIASY